MSLHLKRAYDAPGRTDGTRVLVDRLWPRGVSRERAAIDVWLKDVAPSAELRKWFGHSPEKWDEFQKRYRAELKGNEADEELRGLVKKGTVTLIYGANDEERNHAMVLRDILKV